MVLLLGASGYVGQALAAALGQRRISFVPLARKELDYTRFDQLLPYLQARPPRLLINAAGYTGKPNVDACETAREATLLGNTLLPLTIGHACQAAGVPWGHVSSGCIYSGAKILRQGQEQIQRDLSLPELRRLVDEHPEQVHGFTEEDAPNFTFDQQPSSFYSGSKALGERALAGLDRTYIWRLRIPFDHHNNPRNYLVKIQRYAKVYDNVNSLSHLGDFAHACLNLWQKEAPYGTYNLTNPGFVTTRQVVQRLVQVLQPAKSFEFWKNDQEFYQHAAKTPRSNCVLDVSKAMAAGAELRPVEAALQEALEKWNPT